MPENLLPLLQHSRGAVYLDLVQICSALDLYVRPKGKLVDSYTGTALRLRQRYLPLTRLSDSGGKLRERLQVWGPW